MIDILNNKRKKWGYMIICLIMMGLILAQCTIYKHNAIEISTLRSGFQIPQDSLKLSVYWYWINGNISKDGITKDLEAMADVGIGEAFIGNIGLPDEPNGDIEVLSDDWWDMVEFAIREGKRLGITLGMFNSPGWSQSGGPWVKPSEAMRFLISSDTIVDGGQLLNIHLSKPRDTFQDLKVLAFERPAEEEKSMKLLMPHITINGTNLIQGKALMDNDFLTACPLPMEGDSLTVNIESDERFRTRSLWLYPSSQRFRCTIELKKWEDGQFKTVKKFICDRSSVNRGTGPLPLAPIAVSLEEMTASGYQLIFKNVRITGNKTDSLALSEIELRSAPVLDAFVEKQLGVMHQTPLPLWKEYQWTTQKEPDSRLNIASRNVIDISDKMDPDGNLQWEVPKGTWVVSRIGLSPTGTKNHPTSPRGEGLEVDKMNQDYLEHHFDAYIGKILKRMPPEDRVAFKRVVADSYETGPENWTEGFESDFIKRYHYSPIPYLPVINGRIVNTAEESNRFLWDMRRLIADKIAYDYVGGLRKLSEKNGMRVWLENYGHWGFPSEFLMYGGQSHDIGGEFWVEGVLGNVECRAASSAAHIYGHNRVYAESYTAAGKLFERYPGYLKKRGDWSFTEGINQVLLHVYIHQPYEDRNPGMNAWFGTEFNRKNTWFYQSKSWIDYQRRCMFMLQQGIPVTDVCYFIGEDAPKMTGTRNPELPKGYSFDYINAEVIMNRLKVKDGRLTLPNGISYAMMVLPPIKTMRPELLGKITELVRDGAVILGPRPVQSPSLQDYPNADVEVKRMAQELWGDSDGKTVQANSVGKGLVLTGMTMEEAFGRIGIEKDFSLPGHLPVLYTHRKTSDFDIYFITNQSDSLLNFDAVFRVAGKRPELWDPTSGKIRELPSFTNTGNKVVVPLQLFPAQSYFIVFTKSANQDIAGENFPSGLPIINLDSNWQVIFDSSMRGPSKPVMFKTLTDWTKNSDDRIKYYSGTVRYQKSFKMAKKVSGEYFLDLGDVKNMAVVYLNGHKVGGLWTYPWRIDISDYLREGENELTVEVVNLWVNRLIGDARLPENERKTWISVNRITDADPLHASGLLGPVDVLYKP